ncbi:MAG TPA: hypothetical protein P5117_00425 [Spirochaetia bacterium]|nr:hypothetical protein [Spirochaetales bacterium]HRZ87923.1 hypothetical protein [Spirochaetia bacterium]
MKRIAIITIALLLCAWTAFGQTATKYFVAHQGGYIGEATVTVDKKGAVVSASLAEWQGPGGWAEYNSPDGKALLDGAVVRVPDPLANTANPDPMIKGYMFYVYNLKEDGTYVWSQFTPGKDKFAKPARQYERDFEGLMSNPIRAAAYAKAAREDNLYNVTIDGLKVTLGKKASQTVHYGHMDKANKASVYMPLNAGSIGYRYNNEFLLDFFKANPTTDFAAFTMKKAKVTLAEDKNVDAGAKAAEYTAADDMVFAYADVVTGATYSDFPHYALELQTAYQMALAMQHKAMKKK